MKNYKVTVIGIGNILKRDDGLGPVVIEKLKEKKWGVEILIVDGGTAPLTYLKELSGSEYVMIIDALQNGQTPGTIHQFKTAEIKTEQHGSHNYSLSQIIALAREFNNLPREIFYYGIQPAELSFGTELSHPVQESIPHLIRTIQEQINILSGQ
ncbi:MAG: hydrogenase maturation protease [Halanaerobacter sp.]